MERRQRARSVRCGRSLPRKMNRARVPIRASRTIPCRETRGGERASPAQRCARSSSAERARSARRLTARGGHLHALELLAAGVLVVAEEGVRLAAQVEDPLAPALLL